MAEFEVIYNGRVSDEPFSNYLFEIRRAGHRVAELQHNYRGEDHHIRVGAFGEWEPFDGILEGGGQKSLRLSIDGAAQLERRLSQK